MKLIIKNKLISLGGSSIATNEANEVLYNVKGKVLSISRKKYVKDGNKNLLYIVRNKLWYVGGRKVIIYDGNKNVIGILKRRFKLKDDYEFEGSGVKLNIDCNRLVSLTYTITKGNEVIGTMHRDFNLLKDSFTLDIRDDKDAALLLALVIGVDNISDAYRKSNN